MFSSASSPRPRRSQILPSAESSDHMIFQSPAAAPMTGLVPVSPRLVQPVKRSTHARSISTALPQNDTSVQVIKVMNYGLTELQKRCERSVVAALESQSSRPRKSQLDFSISLMGQRSEVTVQQLTLTQVLSHPVCVELFKQEMIRAYSLENLTFYLIAHRYRACRLDTLRRLLAPQIFQRYIVAGSHDEVNLSTQQRNDIENRIKQGDFAADLFVEAERECFHLMEVNVFDKFVKNESSGFSLACWIHALIDVDHIGLEWLKFRNFRQKEQL